MFHAKVSSSRMLAVRQTLFDRYVSGSMSDRRVLPCRGLAFLLAGWILLGTGNVDSLAQDGPGAPLVRWSFESVASGVAAGSNRDFDGRIHGRPVVSVGVTGKCLTFNGVNDYISVRDAPELRLGDAVRSIGSWVNVHALNMGEQVIVAKNIYAADQREWALMVGNDNRFWFYLWDKGWQRISSTTTPKPGWWYHVAVTVDNGRVRIFVNGKLENESKPSVSIPPATAAPLSIGGVNNAGNLMQMLYGSLEEVTLWSEVLSAESLRAVAATAESIEPVYEPLLAPDWDPVYAGNKVLDGLISVTAPPVKGAHCGGFIPVENHAYIVSTVNDEGRGHSHSRPEYVALSIVNLDTLELELASIPIAQPGQVFENETLRSGVCWCPRVTQINDHTLRIFFANEFHDEHSQIWYRDFDLRTRAFANSIHRAKLRTSTGVSEMQAAYFHADAVAHGFTGSLRKHGLYVFDSFRVFDGTTYVGINNFPGRQNALAKMNDAFDTFEIVAHINEPEALALSENSINRLPDGTWKAILRSQAGRGNYAFSKSQDGRNWTPAEYSGFVRNGSASKPTFDRFNGIYYLGWQDAARIDGVSRSVFNVDISRDGRIWERKYRFETTDGFDYPTFLEHKGIIWLRMSGKNQRTIEFGRLDS